MRLFSIFLATIFLVSFIQDIQAFDVTAGNALWGKYAIQTCRSCHEEQGLTLLDPKEQSAEQWDAFFEDDLKKLKEMGHDFSAAGIDEKKLENIHRYLIDQASNEPGAFEPRVTQTVQLEPAGSESFNKDAGKARLGRYILKKCVTCHTMNNGPRVSPGDRSKVEWSRLFADDFRKFKEKMPEFDTYKYSIPQMEHLHQFLLQCASDAENKPASCGR